MTFPIEGDEVIYEAYTAYQEMCGPDGEDRYPHYWSYVQDQVENYRHLIREEDTPENQEFLNRLEAEVLRHIELEHGQAEDTKRIIGAMRPQAYDPNDPVDGEIPPEPHVHVTVDLTVFGDDPEQTARDWLATNIPENIFIDDVFTDDPE